MSMLIQALIVNNESERVKRPKLASVHNWIVTGPVFVIVVVLLVSIIWLAPAVFGQGQTDSLHQRLPHTSILAGMTGFTPTGHIGGSIHTVAVGGNNIYIGEGPTLVIFDVSNPISPTLQGKIYLPAYSDVWDICVVNHYAYVADDLDGLRIVDVADPMHPVEVGFHDTPGWALGVTVAGDYAYIADGDSGLRIVNIVDPAHPVEVGFYDTPGWSLGVTVAGDYVYVADGDAGLRIVDVADPVHPVEIGSYGTLGSAYDVAIVGNYAYIAASNMGLRIVDVSAPNNLVEVGSYVMERDVQGIALNDMYAYLAATNGGLRVIDISDPTRPTEIGFHDGAKWAQDVAIIGDYAFVADLWGRLWVINIVDPAHPVESHSYKAPFGVMAITVAKDHVYMSDFFIERLSIVDVAMPTVPTMVGAASLSRRGWYGSIVVDGDYAYHITNGGNLS